MDTRSISTQTVDFTRPVPVFLQTSATVRKDDTPSAHPNRTRTTPIIPRAEVCRALRF